MEEPTTVAKVLDMMRTERARWDELISAQRLDDAQLMQSGVEGEWSIKDIIAHLTYYENSMADRLGAIQRGEPLPRSEFAGLSIDERNAILYERNRARPLADVLRASQLSFQRSLDVVQGLRDEDLYDPEFSRKYGVDWTIFDLIEGDTFEHYQDHIAPVRVWLDRVTTH